MTSAWRARKFRVHFSPSGFSPLRPRARRVWGHVAIFAWSDLTLDRSRKLNGLKSPATCVTRAGGDFDSNLEN